MQIKQQILHNETTPTTHTQTQNMKHDLGYDFQEAIKRENLSLADIRAVNDPPISGVPSSVTDKQLANFLSACGSVEEARKVINIYYQAKKAGPEIFSQRDPESKEIQQCLQNQEYFHLPPTKEGYSIVYHRLSNSKASNYHFNNAVKTYFMTIDSCIYTQGPRPGIIFLFDMQNVGLMHLTRSNLSTIRQFFHYLQDALPAKLHSIHVLNVVSFFNKILYLVKPFMKKEIFNMLHLHPSSMNWDEFYKTTIPKSSLPSDYGGDLPSVKELHESHIKEFLRLRDYFLEEEEQRKSTMESSDSE